MKIIAVHLFNDFSGSPRVLAQLVRGWISHELNVTVVCNEDYGLLSDIPDAKYRKFRYRWHANRIMRLINLLVSQLRLLMLILRIAKRNDIVYVNTVLPFAAALAGKMKGCRIVYHLHETSVRPAALKSFLFGTMNALADDVVYVSQFLLTAELVRKPRTHLLPNAIEQGFLERARQYNRKTRTPKQVLMACSLKAYKGVDEFVALASLHPELYFQLVLNATQADINAHFREQSLPVNLKLFPVQKDLHPFYENADVIVNLSRPDEWVETFGLTILEGMAYGLPALVPPVGGITELVKYGRTGYWTNSRNLPHVSGKLKALLQPESYPHMQAAAADLAATYSEEVFVNRSIQILKFYSVELDSKKWNSAKQNK
jgi:L-malate glycosyltransferase